MCSNNSNHYIQTSFAEGRSVSAAVNFAYPVVNKDLLVTLSTVNGQTPVMRACQHMWNRFEIVLCSSLVSSPELLAASVSVPVKRTLATVNTKDVALKRCKNALLSRAQQRCDVQVT